MLNQSLYSIFIILNWIFLKLTLFILYTLICNIEKSIWKKTKFLNILSYIFIFFIIPFTWWFKWNFLIWYFKYDLNKAFILTNIITFATFIQFCINIIFIDKYYSKLTVHIKFIVQNVIIDIIYILTKITIIILFLIKLYTINYSYSFFELFVYWKYLFFITTYLFILFIIYFEFLIMYLNYITYTYSFFKKNNSKKKQDSFKFKKIITRNNFHFICLVIITTLIIFILTHIYIYIYTI